LKLFNIFVVMGYNYRKYVTYTVLNKVGKMTSDVYITRVLPEIKEDLTSRGLTLCQDADSAHKSQAILKWAEANGIDVLTLPGNSPDLSIAETMARPIKRLFHAKRTTERSALIRFQRVWDEELNEKKIQRSYDYYTKRLHTVRRVKGQMTQY
jgi:hypothetical protein